MKKVLLTYGYHKSGHYSAVSALREELESRGMTSETCNLWDEKSPTIDALFTIFRTFAVKGVKNVPDFLISNELLDLFAEELPFDKDLDTYDAIISTHQYSTSVLAAHKQNQDCKTSLIHVHTNYTPFPLRTHPLIDFYTGATPREDSGDRIHKKLIATGIPVRRVFRYDGKPKEKKIIILGGADGFGEIEKIVEFATKLNSNYKLQIVCGRNNEVYEKLRKKFPGSHVQGFIDDLSGYFNRAEFVITKASGLTIAEALNCECIPLFPPPILSWEEEAAKYLCAQGVGVCLPKFDSTSAKIINELLNSDNYKQTLRQRIQEHAKPDAAKRIVDLIEPKSTIEILSNPQEAMIPEMRRYHKVFSSTQDLPKLTKYVTEQIEEWLNKYESNNSS